MPTVDGVAALQTFQSYSNMTPGRCLLYTWLAYKAHGATSSTTYATAMDAYNATGDRHTDKNPPAGVPVWFGANSSSSAGDVGISAGNGMVSAVWYSGWHTVSIDQRAAETGRPYLGWTGRFMTDNVIQYAIPASGGGGGTTTDATFVQSALNLVDNAGLTVDGNIGPLSTAAIKKFQSEHGLTADGIAGPITQNALVQALLNRTGASLTVDGQIGPMSTAAIKAFQQAHGLTVDGIAGPQTKDALLAWKPVQPPQSPSVGYNATSHPTADIQTFLHITADGQYGPATTAAVKAYQASVGLTADGIWGPLTDAKAFPSPVIPPDAPDNPRNLPTYTPVYPGAKEGLVAPLGDGARGSKGNPPVEVPVIIDRFIIHHTSTPGNDQLDYFSYKNDRSSCPTWYLRTDGSAIELIRPKMKPCSTGPEWNWRSVAVEVLDVDANWTVSDAQLEWLAQAIAWLAEFDGKELDGVPVSFAIDRDHVIGHRDAVATACPGDFLYNKIPSIITRAQAIYDANHPVVVPPDNPQPPVIDVAAIQAALQQIDAATAAIGKAIST